MGTDAQKKWISVIAGLTIFLGSGIILLLHPSYFEIQLADGTIKANYQDGELTLYKGNQIAIKDNIHPYYWNGKGYIKMYKSRGNKYSNLSYYSEEGTTYIQQTIHYSQGDLIRYFDITNEKIKESFEWIPKDPKLKTYFSWDYTGLDKNKEKVYYDKNTKITETLMDYNIKNNWELEKDNTIRVERYKNGKLSIRTRTYEGNAFYDPQIILTEPPEYIDNRTDIPYTETIIKHSLNWSDDFGLASYNFRFCDTSWDGATCEGDGTEIDIGETDILSAQDSGNDGVFIALRYLSTVNGTVNKVKAWVATGGIYYGALYDGTSQTPTKVREGSAAITCGANDWCEFPINSTPIITGRYYWTVIVSDIPGDTYKYSFKTNRYCYQSGTTGTWINFTLGGEICYNGVSYSIHPTYTPGWVQYDSVNFTGLINTSYGYRRINETVGQEYAWCFYAYDINGTANKTSCDDPFTYTSIKGTPDINLSYGPPDTNIFRFNGCGPDKTNISSTPEGQDETYGIDKICNNGTGSGDLDLYLSEEPSTGWFLYASNMSNVDYNNVLLSNLTHSDKLCYQETATIATHCGGRNTGLYAFSGDWLNPTYVYDGYYNTHGSSDNGWYYVNYTKPTDAHYGTKLQVAVSAYFIDSIPYIENYTLSQTCLNKSVIEIKIQSIYEGVYISRIYCKNANDWEFIDVTNHYINEEAMYWNISVPPTLYNHMMPKECVYIWWKAECTNAISNPGTYGIYNITT